MGGDLAWGQSRGWKGGRAQGSAWFEKRSERLYSHFNPKANATALILDAFALIRQAASLPLGLKIA